MQDLANCFTKQCKTKECCLPLPCMHGKSRLGRSLGQEYTTHPAPCKDSGWHAGHGTCSSYVSRQTGSGQKKKRIVLATRRPGHFIHCTPVILISTSVELSAKSNGQAGLRKMWKDYRPASSFSLLLLFFSIRFRRFSSRRLASSASWCRRHLWKFSTTTPTNMLSTKKATINRKEMKYSSIHGLWFIIG